MVTDATFRVRRTRNTDHSTSLVESREIRMVNGKPPDANNMKWFPSLLSGAFADGFAAVSVEQRSCMRYTLERGHARGRDEAYVVNFSTALTPGNRAGCLLQEKSKGRVFIDPVWMEITRLELTTPRHVIVPADATDRAVIGKRTVTIDYAPVLLDGDRFWLPLAISSRDVSTSEGFHVTVWSFEATYSNYHRLEVKSRILPGTDAVVQ